MSRTGQSRQALRIHDYSNTMQNFDNQSTGSLRAKSREGGEDAASQLFNYIPRQSPQKNGKSILYRLHNKPRKQLNIIDGNMKVKQ
jgi:hypothetical protein